MTRAKLAILDLDDTLIDTSHVYWVSREKYVSWASRRYKKSPATIRDEFEALDHALIKEYGFWPGRYAKTMQIISERNGDDPLIFQKKSSSFTAEITKPRNTLKPFSNDFLLGLSNRGYTLFVLTRGDPSLQEKKIKVNGLKILIEDWKVVEKKTPEIFSEICKAYNATPECCISIGDSYSADIEPAKEAGMKAIHIVDRHHNYIWTFDHAQKSNNTTTATNLIEALKIIDTSGISISS